MNSVVALDIGPLGLVTKRLGISEAERCRDWVGRCARRRVAILVPALAYYKVGQELERMNNTDGTRRLVQAELWTNIHP